MAKPRIKIPKSAAAGEVVTVKILMKHVMESGQRKDRKTGELIPRLIINRFDVTFNGEPVMGVDLEPAISANPYFEFQVKVPESGDFNFKFVDDSGAVFEDTKKVTVG